MKNSIYALAFCLGLPGILQASTITGVNFTPSPEIFLEYHVSPVAITPNTEIVLQAEVTNLFPLGSDTIDFSSFSVVSSSGFVVEQKTFIPYSYTFTAITELLPYSIAAGETALISLGSFSPVTAPPVGAEIKFKVEAQFANNQPGLVTGPGLIALSDIQIAAVPIPAAVWLFGSGLLGLVGIARHKKTV